MLNKHSIGLLVFALATITIVFGEVAYFDSYVNYCYEGNVTLTDDNIYLLGVDWEGSCMEFGLVSSQCPKKTHGCFVTSTNPSKAPALGDTLTFGCGENNKCDELPGYNCCPYDNCNCREELKCDDDNDYEENDDEETSEGSGEETSTSSV